MQNPLTFRSIVTDKIYKKFSSTSYQIHKQKLHSIYSSPSLLKHIQNQQSQSLKNLARIERNKRAYQSCHSQIESKQVLENKALFSNLRKIMTRRSTSEMSLGLGKNHYLENQKKEIVKENRILGMKLALTKLDVEEVRKQLRKDIKLYEEKKQMLRKNNYQSPKKKNNGSQNKSVKEELSTIGKDKTHKRKKNVKSSSLNKSNEGMIKSQLKLVKIDQPKEHS